MSEKKQLECRIIITRLGAVFELGMYDPVQCRHEPLGKHPIKDINKIVDDLRTRMEREGHLVTFSEWRGPR